MILASAAFAGLVAIGVTVAIERLGGQLGGLIGTLPSTIVPAAAGIAAQGDPLVLWEAMMVTPAGMLLNAVFLYLWRVLPPRLPAIGFGARLALMLGLTLSSWCVLALGVVGATRWWVASDAPLLPVGVGLTLAILGLGIAGCIGAPPAPRGRHRPGPVVLAARGLVAAVAIGASVWLSSRGNGAAAGVASVFPAIFLTTMASLWVSQGEAVQGGAVGPMMLGSTSVAVYAIVAAFTLPQAGLFVGSVAAWLIAAVGVTVPAWWWLRRPQGQESQVPS